MRKNNDEENTHIINIFNKLRDKKSNSIISELYKFINTQFDDILSSEKINNIPTIIQDFISTLTQEFIKCWDLEIERVLFYTEIVEGMEALILKSLYSKLFIVLLDDIKFDKICKKFSFLSLKHLNIEIFIDDFELAKQMKGYNFFNLDLIEIVNFRSPKEKSMCVVNYCNHIISKYKVEKNNLIKLLVFTILKSNISSLKTHIRFISLYRNKTVSTSEESYFILMFSKAINFIENLRVEDLNITKKEYNYYSDEIDKKDILNIKNKSICI